MTDLEVIHATGEIVAARMTPTQAAEWSAWVRDLMRSALSEGIDYGIIPHTGNKPTMYKSGGEMLLRAAGLGFTIERLADDDYSRDHQGVTYRCTVVRPDGTVVAECDGYCDRDEPGRRTGNWNTIVKIAQKRAMVGAALNATASSGLFNADLDDEELARPAPAKVDDLIVPLDEKGFLRRAISELSEQGFEWFDGTQKADPMKLPLADANNFRRSHRDRLAWHILVAQQIKPQMPLRAVENPEDPF